MIPYAMRVLSGLFLLLKFFPTDAQQKPVLSVEMIMQDPRWIGTQPSTITWAADGKSVYFKWNPEKAVSDSVYRYELRNSNPTKAGKDGQFEMQAAKGVRNTPGTKVAFIFRGDLYLRDLPSGKTIRITKTLEDESDPHFLSTGTRVVYQCKGNLYQWSADDGSTLQLTDFQSSKNGSAKSGTTTSSDSLLSKEEFRLFQVLNERKRKDGWAKEALQKNLSDTIPKIYTEGKQVQNLQISPDGRYISYRLFEPPAGVKPTQVPSYVNESGYVREIAARENVGNPQGSVSFFLFDLRTGEKFPFKADELPGIKDQPTYFKEYPGLSARFADRPRSVLVRAIFWNPSSTKAILEVVSQDNKDRWLICWDASRHTFTPADRQHDEAWIGGPAAESSVEWLNDNRFCFLSEASGYSQLYSLDLSSGLRSTHTSGNFEVQQMHLSKDKKAWFLLTNATHPGEQHWYRLSALPGSKPELITRMTGGYEVSLSPDNQWIAYRYSNANTPWELYVQENRPGTEPVQITRNATTKEFRAYPWRIPELVSFPARDSANVYARLYQPEPGKKNGAAVVFVHGAGYLQNAHKRWSQYFREFMFHHLLADLGYTVIDVDYRGSSGYGRDWRTGIYRHMGGKDLDDQVDAVKFLVDRYKVDPKKVGIYGGSYGGFITLMALFTKPGMFKAGAALRSVTDWAHYNHGYTSNILNEPQTDSLAYRRSSPIYFAEGLQDRLLMCHGMVDVNVHFQDVVRLSQRLIELRKENWELAVYPVEDHGFVEPSSWADEYKRILKLFQEELGKD